MSCEFAAAGEERTQRGVGASSSSDPASRKSFPLQAQLKMKADLRDST